MEKNDSIRQKGALAIQVLRAYDSFHLLLEEYKNKYHTVEAIKGMHALEALWQNTGLHMHLPEVISGLKEHHNENEIQLVTKETLTRVLDKA